jgi:hypothetical protein
MLEVIDWGETPQFSKADPFLIFFELNCFLDLGGKVESVVKTEFVRV